MSNDSVLLGIITGVLEQFIADTLRAYYSQLDLIGQITGYIALTRSRVAKDRLRGGLGKDYLGHICAKYYHRSLPTESV